MSWLADHLADIALCRSRHSEANAKEVLRIGATMMTGTEI
jgi:hypothetical protein